MLPPEDTDNEEGSIGFVDWLWPVPNDIKALYFVLTSASIIIVLSWRAWYEVFVAENQAGPGVIAIEVIGFSPAAGFFSMFVMSILMAGGLAMFGKSIFRRGVIAGEERGEARGLKIGEARGREIGKSQGLSDAASWYQRKLDSEARGEPFDEPPPGSAMDAIRPALTVMRIYNDKVDQTDIRREHVQTGL